MRASELCGADATHGPASRLRFSRRKPIIPRAYESISASASVSFARGYSECARARALEDRPAFGNYLSGPSKRSVTRSSDREIVLKLILRDLYGLLSEINFFPPRLGDHLQDSCSHAIDICIAVTRRLYTESRLFTRRERHAEFFARVVHALFA